jgi:hypothetical protein
MCYIISNADFDKMKSINEITLPSTNYYIFIIINISLF